jgi:hypothetical protein
MAEEPRRQIAGCRIPHAPVPVGEGPPPAYAEADDAPVRHPTGCLRNCGPGASVPAMRILTVAILSALLCAGAAAQDKIYKVRLPDGRILFTDRPPAGAKILSEREVPRPSPERPAASSQGDAVSPLQQRAADAEARLRERAAEVDRAFAAVQAAERELEQAKQALEQGQAPLPGEMIGTARGRVQPSPAYRERIAGLEKAVAEAEQKLAKARNDLNAVR